MWHEALPLHKREHSLLSLQWGSHHPPRRLMFSSLQQPFLIWPALDWHIPEPKCTHKLLSLVVRLFTPEWPFINSGWAFSIGLCWQGKRPVVYYFNTIWLQKCLSRPFCPQSLLLHSCFLEGHQPTSILALHPANIGSYSWRQNIVIHKVSCITD